ncbi:MAG TPA: hypothetical protein VNT30_13295 [Stellaceae bacterium]|nr:hypothetical protein [Stellaceae bacterium]
MKFHHLLLAALTLGVFTAEATGAEPPKKHVVAAPGGPQFVEMRPITMAVVTGDRAAQQVSVVVALELTPGHTIESVNPDMPKLVNAFFTSLTAAYEEAEPNGRLFDAMPIKQRLLDASADVLGPGIVAAVLIEQVNERSRGR